MIFLVSIAMIKLKYQNIVYNDKFLYLRLNKLVINLLKNLLIGKITFLN